MFRLCRCCVVPLFVLFLFFAVVSNVYSADQRDFLLLNPDDCAPLDKKVVMQLPAEWHKYADFVKICGLKRKGDREASVSIISVWAHDYYDSLPAGSLWKDFPFPLIINKDFRRLGELPELYPTGDIATINLYCGKWQGYMPTEIRVDVINPAVEGNYFYAPLVWNKQNSTYRMKKTNGKEITYGSRPGR
jgi:hypothetical protein